MSSRRLRGKRYASRLQRRVEWFIDLFLSRHAGGLSILLGAAPFPQIEELEAMLRTGSSDGDLGVRVQGGVKMPEAQRAVETAERVFEILDEIGGMERVNKIFRLFREERPRDFAILHDHTKWIRTGRPISVCAESAQDIADRYNMHVDTFRRARNYIVALLAQEICYRSDDDGLVLRAGTLL